MSKEIIKVLDALAEKFGVAVDWTSSNVLPYLQQICGKYIKYEIVTSILWIILASMLLFMCRYLIGRYKINTDSLWDLVAIICSVIGVMIIITQLFDIVTCVTLPEKIIYNEIYSIYRNFNG